MPDIPTTIPVANTDFEHLVQIIFERSPIGIYTINADGIIDSFNPKMVEMAGAHKAEDVIGLKAFEMDTYKQAGLTDYFRRGLEGNSFETEVQYQSLTGKKTTWRHYRGVPLFCPDGKKVERLLLFVSDITDRKKLEEQLRQEAFRLEDEVKKRTQTLQNLEEQYHSVIEGSLIGFYVLQNGVFVYVNSVFVNIFGYDNASDIINHPWKTLIFTDDIPLLIENGIDTRMQGKGSPKKYAFRGVKKNGEIITVEVMSNPATFEGKPAIIGSLRDISVQTQMEEKNKAHLHELEVFQQVAVDRELKMVELKTKIEQLEKELQEAKKR